MLLTSKSDHCRFAGTKASHEDAVYYYRHEACEVDGRIDADRRWKCTCPCHLVKPKPKKEVPAKTSRTGSKLGDLLKNLKAKQKKEK